MRSSKLPKSFRARKVIFLPFFFFFFFYRLPVVFCTNKLNEFLNLEKLKMFLLSEFSKTEFLVMNFLHGNNFSGPESFREFEQRTSGSDFVTFLSPSTI